ncbi:hypothetical protein RB653_006860 [Dictyostelium firmibasis]|uniref:FNIP repeat-containing protein n=1 Tax=Dictyostelium firmibasis TaxID=79012 RepID=A0AAN7TTN9_9MYCE
MNLDINIGDDKNSLLFFKIWRNCVLKGLILKHLIMFNLLSFQVDERSFSQIFIQENKQYIKSTIIEIDDKNDSDKKITNLINLMESIKLDQIKYKVHDLLKLTTTTTTITNSLKIKDYLNNLLPNQNIKIFSNLTTLEFGSLFNQPLKKNILPISLKNLKFGYNFNQAINKKVLPKSLEKIGFGFYFNQSIKYLPDSIKEIKFLEPSRFNQIINSNELPSSITKLSLPRAYNTSLINGILPNTIIKLKVTNLKTNATYRYFKILQHLKLKLYNKNGNLSSLSDQLSKLLNTNSKIIPPSVTNLSIFFFIHDELSVQGAPNPELKIKSLSSLISSISLNTTSRKASGFMIFNETSYQLLQKCEDIKSLKVNCIENYFTLDDHSKTCLNSLMKLDLNGFLYRFYNKPVKDFKVFTKLKCLRLGNYNSTISKNTLPQSLELLELGDKFKQPCHKKWLPTSLKYLVIQNYNNTISIGSLPDSLESLWISNYHYQLKDFKFFYPLLGKLKICEDSLISKAFNKIYKKKFEIYLF